MAQQLWIGSVLEYVDHLAMFLGHQSPRNPAAFEMGVNSMENSFLNPGFPCACFRSHAGAWHCHHKCKNFVMLHGKEARLFQDQWQVMEVQPQCTKGCPIRAGIHCIQVIYIQHFSRFRCNQTSIPQCLDPCKALGVVTKVRVMCVHGDVNEYPLVAVMIQFRGQNNRIEAAVSPFFRRFHRGECVWMGPEIFKNCMVWDVCSIGRGGVARAVSITSASGRYKEMEVPRLLFIRSLWEETLRHTFNQVNVNDGQQIQPNLIYYYPTLRLKKSPVVSAKELSVIVIPILS